MRKFYLFILLNFLFVSDVFAETPIDLTKRDLFIRSGFETAWLNDIPDGPNWKKILASKEGNRSVILRDITLPTNQTTENAQSHPIYTLVTSFLVSTSELNENEFLGLYLATIGDNWAIYLNGNLIRSEIYLKPSGKIATHRFLRDVLLQLDKRLLVAGENILAFKLIGETGDESLGFYLGKPYLIDNFDKLTTQRDNLPRIVLTFTYLLLSVFFLFMYQRRKQSVYNLSFGLCCIVISIYFYSRSVMIQEVVLNSLNILRIEYISLFLLTPPLMSFFDHIFQHRLAIITKIYGVFCLSCSVLVLLNSNIINNEILRIWQYSALIPLVYIFIYHIGGQSIKTISIIYKQQGKSQFNILKVVRIFIMKTTVGILFLGTLAATLSSVIDIYSSLHGISASNLTQYGFFIFMIANATVLIDKFVSAQSKAELLSKDLDAQVKLRTTELETANVALASLNDKSYDIMGELEIARNKADAANLSKSDFLANMSHEIRTPINGVTGMIELLFETNLTALQENYLKIARGSANSLLNIINDILDISKIEAGKLDIELISFNLKDLIDEYTAVFIIDIESKRLTFNQSINESVPLIIQGDPNRLKQVLVNLMSNAIKFTSKGTITLNITVDSKSETDAVLRFSLLDTGIGLSNEQSDKLFKKFEQADSSTTRKYGGTGLGLAISKQLAEAMNGEIGVKSEEGVGSEFWFTSQFTLSATDKQMTTSNYDGTFERANYDGLKILVAEDNITNQVVIKAMLKKLKVEVTIAENGIDALNKMATDRFSLILMDMQMPEMGGIEATSLIRSGRAGLCDQSITIVAVTANAMLKDKERCIAVGMDDYLSKPITFKSLEAVLTKWL